MHLATPTAKVHHINDESNNDNDVRNLHSYIFAEVGSNNKYPSSDYTTVATANASTAVATVNAPTASTIATTTMTMSTMTARVYYSDNDNVYSASNVEVSIANNNNNNNTTYKYHYKIIQNAPQKYKSFLFRAYSISLTVIRILSLMIKVVIILY